MVLNGAQIIIRCLKEQGTDTVFGYPGSSVLGIYDELFHEKDTIRHILTSHEQGAAHSADGYARSTGKVGVCIATSGPGATNLVTGIATAYMDSVPIVALTCNVERDRLGKDSFQEVDINGITMPITKHGFIVKDIEVLSEILRRAFLIAKSGRKGPVIVDITKDVLVAETEYEPAHVNSTNNVKYDKSVLKSTLAPIVRLMKEAKKPFLLLGGGVIRSNASDECARLSELLQCPVGVSLMGKGAFDETSEAFLGMLGVHGSEACNRAVRECDLLIALGIRFSDRLTGDQTTFCKQAKIVQVDIDPAELNKNVVVDAGIIGDIKQVLKTMLPLLKTKRVTRTPWLNMTIRYKNETKPMIDRNRLNGPMIIDCIYRLTNGEALLTTEVGQHQMWAAQFYKLTKAGTFLTSGGLGTMGYGLSAAIGAKLGNPEKTVINIAGDGCFRMNMNELLTASRHGIPIVQVVFDNQTLGMVYQWQKTLYGERYSQTELTDKLDFVKLSEALGIKAYRITKPEEAESVFLACIQSKEPVVVDCVLSKDDCVAWQNI